jgi:O-Antigen ligase
MLLNIKALIVVLLMIGLTSWVVGRWMGRDFLPVNMARDIAFGWAGISFALFLSPNFWIFALLVFCLLYWLGQRQHPATLFAGLIYSAPYLEQLLPGIGGINQLLSISYPRLLALTCLLLWFSKWKPKKHHGDGSTYFDTLLLIYGLYALILQLMFDSLTNSLRFFLYFLIDAMLVYWIARSWATDRKQLKEAISSFMFGAMIVCTIAAFEFGKRWLLYANVGETLKAYGTTGEYLLRGDTGLIRASATTGHSIPMGYLAMVGIILWMGYSETAKIASKAKIIGLGILAAGSIASLSRGPWVALAVGLIFWYSLSPQGLKRLVIVFAMASAAFGLALLTPAKDEIISLIPWVGDSDSGNIDYRTRLIQVSMFLIRENLWFGSPTFMSAPIMQQMIQGQGIIDLVNTYVALALSSGLIGVFLFASVVIGPLIAGLPLYFRLLAKAKRENQSELAYC